jgi:hypothetical protein
MEILAALMNMSCPANVCAKATDKTLLVVVIIMKRTTQYQHRHRPRTPSKQKKDAALTHFFDNHTQTMLLQSTATTYSAAYAVSYFNTTQRPASALLHASSHYC